MPSRLLLVKWESTVEQAWPAVGAGGSTARPALSMAGSIVLRNSWMPSLALTSLPLDFIEPVRSSTIMTSSGVPPHGEHACAWAFRVMFEKPSRLSRYVGALAVSSTVTVFGRPFVQS